MKTQLLLLVVAALPVVALNIPYGNARSDGALSAAGNLEINLDGAAARAWDAVPAAEGSGVYDANQWAVVFKYSSVDIAAGATVTFKNHASRAPVVWLVDGDVTINGTLNLSGAAHDTESGTFRLSEPGPGGFRGGDSYVNVAETGGSGLGPGGSFSWINNGDWAFQLPSYATVGSIYRSDLVPTTYGSSRIVPLIGGSGGSGYRTGQNNAGGGAGGGAILIAATGRITINGAVRANGGGGAVPGSGGAIRLIAEAVSGLGRLEAVGGSSSVFAANSGVGRIRIETPNFSAAFAAVMPVTEAVSPDSPVQLWPAANAPKARIVSVSGLASPAEPRASLGAPDARKADIRVPGGGSGEIIVETDNLPQTATVVVRVSPRSGQAFELAPAAFLSETATPGRLRWRTQTTLPLGYCAFQVRATAQ